MTATLLAPDLRRILNDLARRLGILERRITPAASGDSHDGTGTNSVLVTRSGDTGALASGTESTAVGVESEATHLGATAVGYSAGVSAEVATAVGSSAKATVNNTTAVGSSAVASNTNASAFGGGAAATGQLSMALGAGATASHTGAIAIGYSVASTAGAQVNLGSPKLIFGAPWAVTASSELATNQMTFYLDQTANLLVVKVKYSTGVVKTANIALT